MSHEAVKAGASAERAGLLAAASLAVFVCAVVLTAGGVRASFEIDPVSPAERGAATHVALGRAEAASSSPYRARRGAPGSGAVRVYGFKPFEVRDIDFAAIWVSVLFGRDTHALCLSYQRLKAVSYLEETYRISHGVRVGKLWCLPAVRLGSVTFDSQWLDWTVLFDLAFSVDLGDGRDIFVGLKNPLVSGLARSGGECPASAAIGFGCPVSRQLGCGIEVAKQAGHPTSIAAGVEWSLRGGITLRTGIRTYPKEFCVGVGFRLHRTAVDVAASVLPDLGVTHETGASYRWD
jgi:hypothetical protein